ncbi:MAG: AAA family ATPase [Proteobacteria bacterium]|nr:AAA family ATPase [Pseudomonadota bacterium]
MTARKQLWLLAGGYGAGKSTFFRLLLEGRGIKLFNADVIAKVIDPDNPENVSYDAANIAEKLRENLIQRGVSFCFETVFSHSSKIDFVGKAKALGYEIILVYIHLDTPELNEARVQQRVGEGGHNVPVDKIHTRIPRTMKHIAAILPLVDEARLLGNSSRNNPFHQVAIIKRGICARLITPLPAWAERILEDVPRRE